MRLVTDDTYTSDQLLLVPAAPIAPSEEAAAWPPEVDLILSAMEAGQSDDDVNRRRAERRPHRTRAELSLFAHGPLTPPIVLYTRDVSADGIGFITRERVTLGYNGLVTLTAPNGHAINAPCTVYRCRESINGWYEGSLTFAVEQPELA